jgi:hypothetical protein
VETKYHHLAGAVALALMLWDSVAVADPTRCRRWRRLTWAVMALALVAMVYLHARMGDLMDASDGAHANGSALRPVHKAYLATATLQWLCAMVWLCVTVGVWRGEDGGERGEKKFRR